MESPRWIVVDDGVIDIVTASADLGDKSIKRTKVRTINAAIRKLTTGWPGILNSVFCMLLVSFLEVLTSRYAITDEF
jgi:hypothetical protein